MGETRLAVHSAVSCRFLPGFWQYHRLLFQWRPPWAICMMLFSLYAISILSRTFRSNTDTPGEADDDPRKDNRPASATRRLQCRPLVAASPTQLIVVSPWSTARTAWSSFESSDQMRFTLRPHSALSKHLSSLQAGPNPPKRYSALLGTKELNEGYHIPSYSEPNLNDNQPLRSDTHTPERSSSHNPATQLTLSGFPFSDRAQPPHLSPQSHQAKPPEQPTPPRGNSLHLFTFLHSLESQDFQATLANFNRLSAYQTSRLSTHVYDSLFSLAGRILEQDKVIESAPDQYQPETNQTSSALSAKPARQHQPYTIDYCKVQDRLTKVDQLFHSIQRALSTEQLHFYLQNSILAAALTLRRYHQSSECQASDDRSKELFLHFRDHISSIIGRLPALHQKHIPTAEQLAEVIPFEILGLYSRFLVVFHQHNQGLKLMRKAYYGYLIGRRQKTMDENQQHPDGACNDQAQSNVSSAIETGSLIISLLHHKTHHRLAALKLAVRMITFGGIYPDQLHLTRLLRRMYMSKPEWDSTLAFLAQLTDRSASRWLHSQIAVTEAEDGRVERVLKLSAEALELPSSLQGDFLAPATMCLEIFSHAIQALIDNPDSPEANLPSDLRGAIAIRTRMLESGILPDPGSDDLILRRICRVAQGMKSRVSRHEFLVEMIGGMFPTSKIVPMRSEPLRKFRFASHPGKSPEAFRLMRWLMKSNELDLSLQLFQSISRYGYVSSLAAIPFAYLKRLLEKALYCHPELAMELYLHLHMSGSDRSGELFHAVKHKAIEMGDYRLAEYLLKSSGDQDRMRQAAQITSFVAGFASRRASPGNVAKTISLFDLVWTRWSGLIEKTVWGALWDQVHRLGPVKLAYRPELRPQIDQVLRRLDEADVDPTELAEIKRKLIECVEVSKLIELDLQMPVAGSQSPGPPIEDLPLNGQTKKKHPKTVNWNVDPPSSVRTLEDLIEEYVRKGRLDRAVEASQRAMEMEIVIPGPVVGRVLNGLVDELVGDGQPNPSFLYPARLVDSILLVNQTWRAFAWKVNLNLRGPDAEVVRAMDRFYRRAA